MDIQIPEKAIKLRAVAAQLHNDALNTSQLGYRLKLETAAMELDAEAARLERKAQFATYRKMIG